jgi:hypothetical protein
MDFIMTKLCKTLFILINTYQIKIYWHVIILNANKLR